MPPKDTWARPSDRNQETPENKVLPPARAPLYVNSILPGSFSAVFANVIFSGRARETILARVLEGGFLSSRCANNAQVRETYLSSDFPRIYNVGRTNEQMSLHPVRPWVNKDERIIQVPWEGFSGCMNLNINSLWTDGGL